MTAKKSTKTGKNFRGGVEFSGWPEFIPLNHPKNVNNICCFRKGQSLSCSHRLTTTKRTSCCGAASKARLRANGTKTPTSSTVGKRLVAAAGASPPPLLKSQATRARSLCPSLPSPRGCPSPQSRQGRCRRTRSLRCRILWL